MTLGRSLAMFSLVAPRSGRIGHSSSCLPAFVGRSERLRPLRGVVRRASNGSPRKVGERVAAWVSYPGTHRTTGRAGASHAAARNGRTPDLYPDVLGMCSSFPSPWPEEDRRRNYCGGTIIY